MIQSLSHPERVYIGSAWDVLLRWCNHKNYLRKNKHHSIKLQRHYNKYGEDDLVYEIIEEGIYLCKEHLLSREQGWYFHFKGVKSEIPYFNIREIAGSSKGRIFSEESKLKMSIAKKGKPTWNKGKAGTYTHTEEAKYNMKIAASKKTPMSEETKQKIANAKRGKKRPYFPRKDKKPRGRRGPYKRDIITYEKWRRNKAKKEVQK